MMGLLEDESEEPFEICHAQWCNTDSGAEENVELSHHVHNLPDQGVCQGGLCDISNQVHSVC